MANRMDLAILKLAPNLPSLLGHAIQFYSCFISYSSKD